MAALDGLVRVCALDTALADATAAGEAWLDAAELSRLEGIRVLRRRQQFLAGHWLVRCMAAQACGGSAGDWRLLADAQPRLRLERHGQAPLWASVSHCGALVAATLGTRALGLDLEIPQRPRDLRALASFVLAPGEVAVLDAEEGAGLEARFHAYWTLKEARGKRGGEGLLPGQARRVMARPCHPDLAEAWQWPLPGQGSLALAAWPGLAPSLEGVAAAGPATPWVYEDVP